MGIHAKAALLNDGWSENVRIEVQNGLISRLEVNVPPIPSDDIEAVVVPSMPNLHSHAFQRAMAGMTETRGAGEDSFWSWRQLMYRFALTMTPDQMEAVAAQLYVEMLEAGFGRVGEFHYLHHDVSGNQFANIAELSERIAAAAQITGINLTLLPVFYAQSGFGSQPPSEGQRRFINNLDQFADIHDGAKRAVATLPNSVVGVAPHSLRAVTPEQLSQVVALAGGAPIHIHIAEQIKEVEDCIAATKLRPVEWLLQNVNVDENWCLIHATHMTNEEVLGVAKSGAVAGLCPITEANLGDGTFSAQLFLENAGKIGIGSDSNVLIGVSDELRQLEYSQRLKHRARNVMAPIHGSTGEWLFAKVLSGGEQALSDQSGIAIGHSADIVSLDITKAPYLTRNHILDGWIFGGLVKPKNVWTYGKQVVRDGEHINRPQISTRFQQVMKVLIAQ